MGDYYFLSIPVKRHIAKFINSTEGDHIVINNKNYYWTLIRPYITYRINTGHKTTITDTSFGKIKIKLPQSKMRAYGVQPRPGTVGAINQVLNDYFSLELSYFVHTWLKNDGRYKGFKSAIHEFCKMHNIVIDEDISFDALKKLEFRNRYRRKKLVPHLSLPN